MNILGLHHIAIICSNYDVSKQFYIEILGCTIIAETYREERQSYKLDLQLGDSVQIELFSFPSPPPRPSRPESCGLRHMAFAVEDVHACHAELNGKIDSVEEIRTDPVTGKLFFFFADPDGLPIELYQAA